MQTISQAGVLQSTPEAIPLPMFRRVVPNSSTAPAFVPTPAHEKLPHNVPPAVQSLQKLRLEEIHAGDKVVVKTKNSTYNFEVGENFHSKVIPSKSSARSGEVILMGGLNLELTEHTPNRVYVGGRMVYQFPDEESCILTSLVESIFWVPAKG
jgi:hypothetical protein